MQKLQIKILTTRIRIKQIYAGAKQSMCTVYSGLCLYNHVAEVTTEKYQYSYGI